VPELPDVEVFKRYFDRTASGHRVAQAHVPASRVLRKSASTIRSALKGERLSGSQRHGKYLLVALGSGRWLVLHFGMTGTLRHYSADGEPPRHERLRLDLDDGARLGYSCQRLLGQVDVADDPESFARDRSLGPDMLGLGLDAFRERLAGRSGAIKSTLMNQDVVAGLGNIYTDEALFQAKLHPARPVDRLADEAVRRLHRAIGHVLERAIAAEVDVDRMPRTWLLPHRSPGAECPRCDGKVERLTVGGRAGYLCPSCQRR
jgi:formamidopyrimidine-DNA glycosylase